MSEVITRFAPSPTGHLHIGGVRTALFNWLYARKVGGKCLLRIEDTDRERSKKEYEESILESFQWLGMEYDGLYRQSEHVGNHTKYLQELIDKDLAYISKEVPKEPGMRDTVIRLRNPGKVVSFTDKILGEIKVDTTDLGDFIIAKDLDEPVFHFANVVDDHEMNITLIMRAQEHVSNVPRQILIWEALGWNPPAFAHIPLIVAEDKSKISKRKHGELVSVPYYKNNGYLPEALINFLSMLGWNPGGEQEIFSVKELVDLFEIDKINKSPGVFNVIKLNWINKEHLKKLTGQQRGEYVKKFIPEDFAEKNSQYLEKIIPVIFERISNGIEIKELIEASEFAFLSSVVSLQKDVLNWNSKQESSVTALHLKALIELLQKIDDFSVDLIKSSVMQYADTQEKRGAVLHPMRYALSGQDRSPDPFTIASILGKEEAISRLENALKILD